jgi:hypothetical protein
MDNSKLGYLPIKSTRKTVTVSHNHTATAISGYTVNTDPEYRAADADLLGVHLDIGPVSMGLTSQEALNLATALTEAALFYREKKADALAHYEAMARDAKAGVA